MTIANRLNELIAEKRIQKKQLAERIGVAASTLNTWLSRGEDFPAQYVIPICGVLGISAEKLLEGRDVPLPVIPDDYVQITAEERFLLDTLRNLDREGVIVVTNKAIEEALAQADRLGIHGKEITPFLLDKVKELTGGNSLNSNIQLVFNNARLAARVASCLSQD